MQKKYKIFLLEDDHKVAELIKETLPEYEILVESSNDKFLKEMQEAAADLLLIDFDLKLKDGLLTYKEIVQKNPHAKAIMFSSSNSIPLAVAATKLGALDFLRKPLSAQVLRDSVASALSVEEELALDLSQFADVEWLNGMSAGLKNLLGQIKAHAASVSDIVICGERGVPIHKAAEIVHKLSRSSEKRFAEINLSSFNIPASEAHFFITLKELISAKTEAPGIVYLSGIESISESFRHSLLQFIGSKKSAVRIIIGAHDMETITGFPALMVPPLASRREDVLLIALAYIRRFNPTIKYISPHALEFFMYYDFPGNYTELKDMIIAAGASFPGAEVLNLKNLPIDIKLFENVLANKVFSKEKYDLVSAREEYERLLLTIVLEKLNFDLSLTARFLEMPKTQVSERLSILGLPE